MAKSNRSKGRYADGFLLAIPKRKLAAYVKMSKKAGKVWMEHGALEYRECAGDDMNIKMGVPFAKAAKAKSNEVVFFSWIVYRSKKHRDSVNEKIMKDPRLEKMMDPNDMPFDMKRMSYGGFNIKVNF